MDRSTWIIVALAYVAGALSAVIGFEALGLRATPYPAVAPQVTAATPPQPAFDNVKRAVVRTLKDPASAQFGEIFEGKGLVGQATICGEVNAKNGFGGYTGMMPFIYFPTLDKVELITDPPTLQMTERGINAYFKDCRVNWPAH